MHYINERLLENIEHKRLSIFKIYFSKRKFLQTVNKTTASQNVERRNKSSIIVYPSLDVGHGISRGLPNDSRVSHSNVSVADPDLFQIGGVDKGWGEGLVVEVNNILYIHVINMYKHTNQIYNLHNRFSLFRPSSSVLP